MEGMGSSAFQYKIGDLNNNLATLRKLLSNINYGNRVFDIEGIKRGISSSIIAILNFIFMEYNEAIAKYLVHKGYDIYGKKEVKFYQIIYSILINEFDYRPNIPIDNIVKDGYAERKILLLCDIIRLVKQKVDELNPKPKKVKNKLNDTNYRRIKSPIINNLEDTEEQELVEEYKEYRNECEEDESNNYQKESINTITPDSHLTTLLHSKFNLLSERLLETVNTLFSNMDTKVEGKLNSITSRITILEGKVSFLEHAINSIDEKYKNNNNKEENNKILSSINEFTEISKTNFTTRSSPSLYNTKCYSDETLVERDVDTKAFIDHFTNKYLRKR
ncbi:hypothetical protein ABK040_008044 [Willaertia magna]